MQLGAAGPRALNADMVARQSTNFGMQRPVYRSLSVAAPSPAGMATPPTYRSLSMAAPMSKQPMDGYSKSPPEAGPGFSDFFASPAGMANPARAKKAAPISVVTIAASPLPPSP